MGLHSGHGRNRFVVEYRLWQQTNRFRPCPPCKPTTQCPSPIKRPISVSRFWATCLPWPKPIRPVLNWNAPRHRGSSLASSLGKVARHQSSAKLPLAQRRPRPLGGLIRRRLNAQEQTFSLKGRPCSCCRSCRLSSWSLGLATLSSAPAFGAGTTDKCGTLSSMKVRSKAPRLFLRRPLA